MYLGRPTQEYQQNIIIVKLLDFKDKEKNSFGQPDKKCKSLIRERKSGWHETCWQQYFILKKKEQYA